MKKLILSIVAVAALISCSKSDITYDNQETQIGFSPVANNITKTVAGYNGDSFDGIFPTNLNLYVFANALEGDYSSTNYGSPYFENALFKWGENKGTTAYVGTTPTAGAYYGDPTRYWPNVKKLIFAGYSNACNIDDIAVNSTVNFSTNTVTINGYTQNNSNTTVEGTNDLMWFSASSAYTKQAAEIVANMKHACSWITIKVVGDGVTGGKWVLNSLTINDLIHNSTKVELGESAAAWTLPNQPTLTDEVVYSNGTTFIPAPSTGSNPSSTAAKFENIANNTIVIPQTPTSLDITYTYVSDATNNLKLTETKTVPLQYTASGTTNTAWQSGVHYIYTITITATEILIDPVVVDWTNYTGNEIQK